MIRQATRKDLNAIAQVHSICFPESYSSQLLRLNSPMGGGDLLVSFYTEYLNDCPELFFVAADDEKGIVGFCMGYYMDKDNQMQNFMHRNKFKLLWKTVLLMLLCNKPTWDKILSRLKHKPNVSDWTIINEKYEDILNNARGDLLSVCVLPEYRGKGYAQGMIESFLEAMRCHGQKLCLLSVKTDNVRARRYYERNGFELYRKRGEEGLTYIKRL